MVLDICIVTSPSRRFPVHHPSLHQSKQNHVLPYLFTPGLPHPLKLHISTGRHPIIQAIMLELLKPSHHHNIWWWDAYAEHKLLYSALALQTVQIFRLHCPVFSLVCSDALSSVYLFLLHNMKLLWLSEWGFRPLELGLHVTFSSSRCFLLYTSPCSKCVAELDYIFQLLIGSNLNLNCWSNNNFLCRSVIIK